MGLIFRICLVCFFISFVVIETNLLPLIAAGHGKGRSIRLNATSIFEYFAGQYASVAVERTA